MTVKELKAVLREYPDNMEIYICRYEDDHPTSADFVDYQVGGYTPPIMR